MRHRRSSGIIHKHQVYKTAVSQSFSQSDSDKGSLWSDSGPIRNIQDKIIPSNTTQYSRVHSITAQYSPPQPSTAHYSTLQYSAAHHSPVQPNTAQYSALGPRTAQYSPVKPGKVHHSTVQPTTAQNSKGLGAPRVLSFPISRFDFLPLIMSVDNWIFMDQMNVNCSNNFHFLWSEYCLNLLCITKSFVTKFWQVIIITLKMIVVRHKIQNYEEDISIKHMKPIFFLFPSVTCIHPWLKQSDLAKSP